MDYEKKYKQLHKFISDLYPFMSEYCKEKVEGFLPEFKESEDEKIRKFLIKWIQDNYYHGTTEIPTKTLIAWLEKQKTIDVLDAEEREFADNVNSYRKDMDEFYKKDYNAGREAEKQYWLGKQGESYTKRDVDDAYLKGISDAKNELEKQGKKKPRYSIGDVLCDKSCTTLNKDAQPNFEITDIRNGMYICDKCSFPISQQDEYELVAKRIEQKPTFEMKTSEESLGISSEEYKKIVDTCLYGEKIESKPSWNEEDEHRIKLLEALCEDKLFESVPNSTMYKEMKITIDWLNSLRSQPKQEWNREDEKMIDRIRSIIEAYAFSQSAVDVNGELCEKEYIEANNWLKSLKDRVQPKQEWSEEDNETLDRIISNYQYFCDELFFKEELTEVEKQAMKNVDKEDINWLKSLKDKLKGE